MTELIICRGVPASGKSTWAKAWVAESPETRVRINRDDIRFQMFGKYWPVDEGAVSIAQDAMLRGLLKKRDVVLDNTNLKERDVKSVMRIAASVGSRVSFRDFPIDIRVAIQRDFTRQVQGDRAVGNEVIEGFFKRFHLDKEGVKFPAEVKLDNEVSSTFQPYERQPGLPSCIIVDIDGTLAHMGNRRGPYDTSKYDLDEPDLTVAGLVEAWEICTDVSVIIMSGRDADFRNVTKRWLRDELNWYEGTDYSALHMRPAGDTRNDAIVKNELFEKHIAGKYNVDFALDDRDRVVAMWRAKGLKCLQVAEGNF